MERTYNFKIYYTNQYLFAIVAHTKWEAIDRAMSRTECKFNRKNISAIIC